LFIKPLFTAAGIRVSNRRSEVLSHDKRQLERLSTIDWRQSARVKVPRCQKLQMTT